jgi:hypothetical protein
MRSCLVEVRHICIEHALELLLLKNQQVVEALTSHTAQEALTDGIGAWSVIWGFENLDATRLGNPSEAHPKLAIIIPYEIFRTYTKSGGFSKLLCRPSVGGRACHADVDHSACLQFDEEEGKKRAEEEICDRQEVARPDLLGMRV